MLISTFALSGTMGFIKSFSTSYEMFAMMEFTDALVSSGMYITIFILMIEYVGPDKRVFVGSLITFAYTVGQVLLGVIAMYVLHFRTILAILFAPTFFILTYIWLIPESVRWLLSKKRYNEARILLKAAKSNKVNLSEGVLKMLDNKSMLETIPTDFRREEQIIKTDLTKEEPSKYPIIDALKSKTLTIRALNCFFCWFTNTFIYYGLNVRSVAMGGNKYLNFTLVNLSQLPAAILSYYLMHYAGRKISLCAAMILSSVSCIACELLPPDQTAWGLVFVILGKFGISISFSILYVYTSEMFPTNLRQSFMNACSTFGRLGSMLSPQTPLLV